MSGLDRSWGLLARGSHLLGIVRLGTEDHHNMAFGFLKAAVDKGEMAVFVTKEDPVLVKHAMERHWGSTAKSEAEGQLRILSSESVYPRGFKQNSVLSALSDMYRQAISSGFKGLSVADITFLGQQEDHFRSIIECDKVYGGLKLGATTLCMYEAPDTYEFALFSKLLLCHSAIIDHRFNLIRLPDGFFRKSIESALGEFFGENGAKGVLFQLSKIAGVSSMEEFLLNVQEEPESLHRPLTIMFGESSIAICKLIKEKLADMIMNLDSGL